jgi:UDP-2,4-diacetamido-2,4,6-trideoxy-beta-L-altropyranose hydrolase
MQFSSPKRPRALFRVDASRQVGLGHLMRTLALAEALQENHIEPFFLLGGVEDDHLMLVKMRGFSAHRLRCVSGGLLDASFTRSFAQRLQASVVVLDSYRFERGYYEALRPDGFLTVSLDDTGRELPVDMVINPNAGAEKFSYPMARIALQGLQYALLRKEFSQPAQDVNRRGLLISFGGTDPTDATERILRLLPEPPQHVTVLYGGSNIRALESALEVAIGAGHRVVLKPGFHEMYPLMQSAERAISAGGGALLEFACLGVPTLSFAVAENQVPGAIALQSAGITSFGGVLSSYDDADIEEELRCFLRSSPQRCRAIDGLGARRAADVIVSALPIPSSLFTTMRSL